MHKKNFKVRTCAQVQTCGRTSAPPFLANFFNFYAARKNFVEKSYKFREMKLFLNSGYHFVCNFFRKIVRVHKRI